MSERDRVLPSCCFYWHDGYQQYIYIYTYIYIYVYISIYVSVYVYMYIYVYIYIYTYIEQLEYVRALIKVCVCIHTHNAHTQFVTHNGIPVAIK